MLAAATLRYWQHETWSTYARACNKGSRPGARKLDNVVMVVSRAL